MDEIINEHPEEGAGMETKKSNKDAIIERLQKMFPDVDEETMYGNFMEFMDDMERASNAHSMLNEKLTQYPKAGLMLADMMDGKHPAVAIKRHFGEELEVEEGSEEYEALLTAERERLADEEASGTMKAEYQQNLLESAEEVRIFKEEKGLDDEGFQEFVESAIEFVGDLLSGRLNRTLLDNIWKIRNYESELSIAEQRGLIAARNEKIEEKKRKMAGDGLPNVTSSAVKTKTPIPNLRGSVWDYK